LGCSRSSNVGRIRLTKNALGSYSLCSAALSDGSQTFDWTFSFWVHTRLPHVFVVPLGCLERSCEKRLSQSSFRTFQVAWKWLSPIPSRPGAFLCIPFGNGCSQFVGCKGSVNGVSPFCRQDGKPRLNHMSDALFVHQKRTIFKSKEGAERIDYASRRCWHATGWIVHGFDVSLYSPSPTFYQLVDIRPFRLEAVRVLELYVLAR